ncbi:hypothetical protein TVAG_273390 [Trichomonas vaginalis G3]|uniref:Uncharacterized protein n=1 Tax=Trichomonas vaginalis (strain ATCC PRA-98 / G3) TaxID=412133 RepID=A2EZW5_TRIV3|nr:coiled-coil domain-containing protein 87 family [Trichomonas vaginalis G3]EAY01828.1 hypothetical protein TVAG_273390 [Trichomonas vaginalis G3]KAI5550371.1 coiled-coil domain-containing protein 87 family [Trichomonas vaginalis G3]|eukprot:XP_001314375.1 hypothetical protein [Trichomonas vaginalis G3]
MDYLDDETTETLLMKYGCSNNLPVVPDIQKPSSLEESIEKAGKYVLKLRDKRFPADIPVGSTPGSVYKQAYIEVQKKNQSQANDIFKFPSHLVDDPTVEGWYHMTHVTQILKEINSLPYKDIVKKSEMIKLFQEKVINLVKIMKKDGLIVANTRKKPSTVAIDYFVKELNKCRKELIDKSIKENQIDNDLLTGDVVNEFISPQKSTLRPGRLKVPTFPEEDGAIEEKITRSIAFAESALPPSYRYTDLCLNDESRKDFHRGLKKTLNAFSEFFEPIPKEKAQTVPVSPRDDFLPPPILPKTPLRVLTRPVSRINTPKKVILKPQTKPPKIINVWHMTDPIAKFRNGVFVDELKEMSHVIGNLEIPPSEIDSNENLIPDVLKVGNTQAEQPDNQPNMMNDTWNTDLDDKKSIDDKSKEKLNVPLINEEHKPDPYFIQYVSNAITSAESAKELLSHYELNKNDQAGTSTEEIFQNIWKQLGFSMRQRLEMLVKYTNSSDEASKLTDSLPTWEKALQEYQHYTKCYTELRDFIRFEYAPGVNDRKLNELHVNIQRSEEALTNVATTLRENYGDELIIHRKSSASLIQLHQAKIRNLLQEKHIA